MVRVKCPYCNEYFDRDSEPYILIGRRYAHPGCAAKAEQEKPQLEKDKDEVYEVCKRIFGKELSYMTTMRLFEKYIDPNGKYKFTTSGVIRTLVYYYEILKNPVTKEANNTIGIVPFVYQQAYDYYFKIWEAQESNKNISFEEFKPKEVVINIPDPKCEVKKRKLFSFLDEE